MEERNSQNNTQVRRKPIGHFPSPMSNVYDWTATVLFVAAVVYYFDNYGEVMVALAFGIWAAESMLRRKMARGNDSPETVIYRVVDPEDQYDEGAHFVASIPAINYINASSRDNLVLQSIPIGSDHRGWTAEQYKASEY